MVAASVALAGCAGAAVTDEPGPPPGGPASGLDPDRAAGFLSLPLACVDREFPNKPGHIYDGEAAVRPPREWTPAFFGCFDWHSAVHGHWAMVRVLRLVPGVRGAEAAVAVLDAHLVPERLDREATFFGLERSRTFERPYGWAWLLRLAAELRAWDHPAARRWDAAVGPLARALAAKAADYLPRLSVPCREGTHQNTAFAMAHMLDYARAASDAAFEALLVARARDFYAADKGCPTDYEPSGEDFVSPCLAEADLMRRVMPPREFAAWLGDFLPAPGSARFARLAQPPEVRDRKDPRIGHLIGLDLHRAWCMEGVASALPAGDFRRDALLRLARLHREAGLAQMADSGYGGEHWLASFAVYLLGGSGR
ncbi:MAG: DUF2891 domain-containing protein [Deltaproteobacteria bacterium]|nr:DUF2891 domain-containing protein [Deltaproteobacteria bacterium]